MRAAYGGVGELTFLAAYQPNAGKEHYGKANRAFLSDKPDKVYTLP
jgi:hypothetical protein